MSFRKISLFYNTVKYLRCEQIFYRIWYFVRNIISPPVYQPRQVNSNIELMFSELTTLPAKSDMYQGEKCFEFLNIRHCFEGTIDWHYFLYGKLWNYNLKYFEFINQQDIKLEDKKHLIQSFIDSLGSGHTGLEPYPISLRGINLIKYLIANNIYESTILESLYGQYKLLQKNIEYHLLGNHLLENGLSLFVGGVFFNDQCMLKKGGKVLKRELEEQIMNDGAHYERTPMYHQLILERILDVINILGSCKYLSDTKDIYRILQEKAGIMLGWLNNMTFRNGSIPHFNDSASGISLNTDKLISYASDLEVNIVDIPLGNSGFRRFKSNNYDCIVDVGDIGPDYQPGHAHSDTFSFVLHIKNIPVIVDTGVSTYENSPLRLSERKTSAHNTFQLKNVEQSDVWSSFRVGRRAYCKIIDETGNSLDASHNGYNYKGLEAKRSFSFMEDKITIKDCLDNSIADGYLHFHPEVDLRISDRKIESRLFDIMFENIDSIEMSEYGFSEGFNKTRPALMLLVSFRNFMTYRIELK